MRTFTLSVAALLIIAMQSNAAERPNVLLICVDDLKPALGCYGDPIAKSPNIDKLASRGLLFERATCNQAVCSPSRNSLLVGLRPQTLGIYDLATNFRKSAPDAVTLPQTFKANGYTTEAMGKLFHVGQGNYDDAASWSVPHFTPKVATYLLKENQPLPAVKNPKDPSDFPRGAAIENADTDDGKYADGVVADEAIRRLKEKKADQPFFMAVGFIRPHLPFVAPKKYWDLYQRDQFKLAAVRVPPVGAPAYAPQFGGELRRYKEMPAKGDLADDTQRTLIHGYYAAMSYMDAQLGRVIDALDAAGLAKNTIIVLWGDHGWHLGDHGMWCKHTNYEQATRIPIILIAPGVSKAGTKTASQIETVDIYPTLCELAGLTPPKNLDGKSFVSVLKDPTTATRDHAIHVYPRGERMGRAIRDARYRLVEWKKPGAAPESAEIELYDYKNDPEETKNLAKDLPDEVARLRKILAAHPEAKPQIVAAKSAEAKPKVDRAELFARKDTNKDGKLSREEFLANQPDPDEAPKRFEKFDIDKDGFLTKDEFVTMGVK